MTILWSICLCKDAVLQAVILYSIRPKKKKCLFPVTVKKKIG